MNLPEGAAHLDSFSSQAACGSSRQRTASSLSSVDHTAHFFLATPNPRRAWQKQVRAGGRKHPLATTTQLILKRQVKRPAYTKMDRVLLVFLARVVRTWKQALFIIQPETLLTLASRALPPLLEAQVKGLFSQTEGSNRNDRASSDGWPERIGSGGPRGFVGN
jgi:hypothetical protein